MNKTNVMRVLDSKKVKYEAYFYERDSSLSGEEVARLVGKNPAQVFKTLVTQSDKDYFVFVIPVNKELNLKKAAKAVSVKKIEMLKQKDLLPLTGYVHGGCSPIGMKKFFKTTIDASAKNFEKIIFNGGKVGSQVEIDLNSLKSVIDYTLFDLVD